MPVNLPKPTQIGKDRYNTYKQKGILKKQYNYMFTGLNDQVITFDVKFNMAFTNTLSRFDGIYYNSSSSNVGKAQHDSLEAEQAAVTALVNLVRLKNSPDANATAIQSAEAAATTAVQKADSLTAKQNNITPTPNPTPLQKLLAVAKNPSRVDPSGLALSAEQKNQQTLAANPLMFVTQAQTQNNQLYASQLNPRPNKTNRLC